MTEGLKFLDRGCFSPLCHPSGTTLNSNTSSAYNLFCGNHYSGGFLSHIYQSDSLSEYWRSFFSSARFSYAIDAARNMELSDSVPCTGLREVGLNCGRILLTKEEHPDRKELSLQLCFVRINLLVFYLG